jgi:hypothetical protein
MLIVVAFKNYIDNMVVSEPYYMLIVLANDVGSRKALTDCLFTLNFFDYFDVSLGA